MRIFRKININTLSGKFRRIYLFDTLVFEYKKNKQKIFNIELLYKNNINKQQPKEIFYLKFNRFADDAYICLQYWIDVINILGGDFYIICDNKKLEFNILRRITFKDLNIKFIKSIKNDYLSKLVKAFITPKWKNAAYAHLSTYYHAKQNNYKDFFNIDSDDILFLIKPELLAKKLLEIKQYAIGNNIDNFSLDMYLSRFANKPWSFGITYSQMKIDYFDIFEKHNDNSWWEEKYYTIETGKNINLDSYFAYLNDINLMNNKVFYIDDSYFIHYGNVNENKRLQVYFTQKWGGGTIIIPSEYYMGLSKYKIDKEAVQFTLP
ncbi:MAG: hypothetical protein K2P17_05220 [Helicobacteraceae bacterium]|nr:hypothetical protein [Helicobacteraceae bacterium]